MISKETRAFTEAAFGELRKHDNEKGRYGWRNNMPRTDLVRKLRKHVELLKGVLITPLASKRAACECLHILNYAFMLYDLQQNTSLKSRVIKMLEDFAAALSYWTRAQWIPNTSTNIKRLTYLVCGEEAIGKNLLAAAACAQFIWLEMTKKEEPMTTIEQDIYGYSGVLESREAARNQGFMSKPKEFPRTTKKLKPQHWIMAPVIPYHPIPRPGPLVRSYLMDNVEYAAKCAVKSAIEFKDDSSLSGVTVFKPDVFLATLVENLTGVKTGNVVDQFEIEVKLS